MSRFHPEGSDAAPVTAARTRIRPADRTRDLVTSALLVSLLAVSAWISIPLGSVPFTLQVFVVVLTALLLTPGWAAATMGLYLAMGAAGLPVFSHGQGGLGVLVGPTGGYLVGFFLGALLGSALRCLLENRGVSSFVADASAAVVCITAIYLLGWIQLAVVTNMAPAAAFVVGVVPYIVPDVIKGAVAIGVAGVLRRTRR